MILCGYFVLGGFFWDVIYQLLNLPPQQVIQNTQLNNQPMESIEHTEQQIKTMFKVAKRLQYAFSDIKRLTTKCLIKFKKIKAKKAQAVIEREERRKREEMERRRNQRIEGRKRRVDQERGEEEKRREEEEANKKANEQPNKSIFSIIQAEKAPRQNKQLKTAPKTARLKQSSRPRPPPPIQPPPKTQPQPQTVGQKPRQPMQPYFRFLEVKKTQIKSTTANYPIEQISKIMRTVWANMTDQEKKPYVHIYEVEKAKYERDMIEYYKPRKGKMGKRKEKEDRENEDKEMDWGDFDFLERLDEK